MLKITANRFDSDGFWNKPIDRVLFEPLPEDFALFDQNGYDLTVLEQRYARADDTYHSHREHRHALKKPWVVQDYQIEGPILNHSNLFERKAYSGAAREQLMQWARKMPLCHTLLALRPKWGLDFAMDYVDRDGNVFEILHWEYDGFEFAEIDHMRGVMAEKLYGIDWPDAARSMLSRKSEWHALDFFGQSSWKCAFLGVPDERFKMVAWA